jgi:ribosomal protein L32
MIGQWRKCAFCKRRFRLTGEKGIIRTQYNYVSLEDKSSGEYKYAHKKCYYNFERTKPKEQVAELKAGFNIRNGLFIEGSLREE